MKTIVLIVAAVLLAIAAAVVMHGGNEAASGAQQVSTPKDAQGAEQVAIEGLKKRYNIK